MNARRIIVILGFLAAAPVGGEAAVTKAAGSQAEAPSIDALGSATLPRSGRLVVHGSHFGAQRGGGDVVIAGRAAWLTTWSDTRIVAYVPEEAPLGGVTVQVRTAVGPSNEAPLEVTSRQSDARVAWTFEADFKTLSFRPALAPDGTIYLHGGGGFAYALTPDGALKWIASLSWYPYVPPSAGPDGTLYTGSIQSVFAVSKSGQVLWEFEDFSAQAVQVAPTIGPDGQLYGVFDPGQPGLGAFSLTPEGVYRWNHVGNPLMYEYGAIGIEMRFGPARAGGTVDQLYFGMGREGDTRIYAFSLDGRQRFAIAAGPNGYGAEPAIGSDGTIYTTDFVQNGPGWVIRAFSPVDGAPLWQYDGDFVAEVSHLEVAPDDMLYYTADYSHLESYDPHAQVLRWSVFTGDVLARPSVSPDGRMLVAHGSPDNGLPGFIKGYASANGDTLWTIRLPGRLYPNPQIHGIDHARFTPDGSTAYFSTSVISGDDGDPHSYLYAVTIACPADFDGDGRVQRRDAFAFRVAWQAQDPRADFDGDGDVDAEDQSAFVEAWRSGC